MPLKVMWYRTGDRAGASEQEVVLSGAEPIRIGRLQSNDIVLNDGGVSRTHATLAFDGSRVIVTDNDSQNGTFVNRARIRSAPWPQGQPLTVGPYALEFEIVDVARPAPARPDERAGATVVIATPPAAGLPQRPPAAVGTAFPGKLFEQAVVPMAAIRQSGMMSGEVSYAAIGGGQGSFTWVDHLRIYGVAESDIRVIGVDPEKRAYGKYARLCANSQIPSYERLRSNSISTPDNIWGFPGYASREAWAELKRGNIGGLKYPLQVFGEPALAESYTPRSGHVFDTMDVEADRIGWTRMWISGRVVAVRKTDDERFVIALRRSSEGKGDLGEHRNQLLIARFVQFSTGYPASNYLEDLQKFRRDNGDSQMVVNAYEEHDEIYTALEGSGGTVLLRGRGIVASRVIQRLWEARFRNPNIRIIHLNRTPVREGHKYRWSKRRVFNDVEHQPFNWPKACWGGVYRKQLENASPEERSKLFAIWGGTTTATRADWDQIITQGLAEGWYRTAYGSVKGMRLDGATVETEIENAENKAESLKLRADYVIDCTGLITNPEQAPLYRDLIQIYALARNKVNGTGAEQRLSGFMVSNSFELVGLRNGRGRAYAAGVVTANGPYAAVDSFLGLNFAAMRSVEQLVNLKAPGVRRLGPLRSARQWLKWFRGAAP
jgi:pSer/pThr/pTyr-binding forkhead associated (FHA) protein